MRKLSFKEILIGMILLGVMLYETAGYALQKNVASQKWVVFAFNATTSAPVTGDAGNITANLRIDGAAANGVDDTNPTELEDGYYIFDVTQAETNGDYIVICPASATGNVTVIGVPGALWTTPVSFNAQVAQTGDSYARIGAPAGASVSADIAAIKSDSGAILTDTSAVDTTTEMRTFLTGGDNPLSILVATDNIGINWGDITNPTSAQNLSGTNFDVDQIVASVSGAVGSISGITFPTNFNLLSIDGSGFVNITQAAADKAWSSAARTLTAGTNIVLAKGSGITGFNDLDAAGVAGAVWNALTASYGTANTYGALVEAYLDAAVSTRGTSTLTAQNVWEYATRSLTDKAGFSLTQAFPTNFASFAISALGKVTVGTNDDKTGYTASTVSDKTGYSLASPQTFNLTGNITGNLSGSVGSVTGSVGSVTGNVTVGGYSLRGFSKIL